MAEEEIFEDGNVTKEVESGFSLSNLTPQFYVIAAVILVFLAGILFLVFSGETADENSTFSGSTSASKSIMVQNSSKQVKKKKRKKVKYARLFGQLDGADSSKILKELSLAEITFSTEQTGQKFSVLVAEDELDEARNLLAIKGLPSGKSKKGFELLDDAQTLGVTEFDKRIRFLRALSGELENAIDQLNIIESSKVQIVLPEQRLFTVTQPPVTAAILIRIKQGEESTDDVVFSIMQMVSNAVENLQLENVSVVDTAGRLLSDGIFERLQSRRQGIVPEESVERVETVISREEAIGSPIIPNYERIQEWFEIKWNFENSLKEKVEKQLFGIMPIASYKVEVSTDIGPLENGNIIDVKRQTISIVVDGLNDEIVVDQSFKQQVFQTIAGAIGYIRGRDSIQLSVAEFALYTEEEKQELINKYRQTTILGYIGNGILLIVGFGLLFLVFNFIRNRWLARQADQLKILNEDNVDMNDFSQENRNISKVSDYDEQLNTVLSFVDENPQAFSEVIEEWLSEEVNEGEAIDEDQNEDQDDESLLEDDLNEETEEEVVIP